MSSWLWPHFFDLIADLSWPLVVLLIVVIFKKSIIKGLSKHRIKSISHGDTKIELDEKINNVVKKIDHEAKDEKSHLSKSYDFYKWSNKKTSDFLDVDKARLLNA